MDGVIFLGVALITVIWPLWGAHAILQSEKERRKGIVTQRMEIVTDELHSMIETHNLTDSVTHKNALDALVVEQNIVSKLSTWPWDPEALRVVVSALLLPVIIWLITRILERIGF